MNSHTFTNLFVMLKENLMTLVLLLGTFTLPAQISISFSGTQPTCYGYTNGIVLTEINGGQAPYNYVWNNGYSVSYLEGVSAGFYSVTVTDALGEQSNSSFELFQPNNILLDISLDDICVGDGNASVNAIGGIAPFVYLWDDNQDTANAVELSPGQHCVTVTDINGCQATACTIIYAPLTVEVLTSGLICATDCDASISAAIKGGFGPYTFNWNNGATTQIVENQPAGTFSVTVTDANGCTTTGTNTIDGPPLLEVVVSVDNPLCGIASATGSATATPSGGVSPYKYFWSTGKNTQSINNLPIGNYYVVITDANNCKTMGEFAIIPDGEFDLDLSSSPASACGILDGKASATASGGTPPYVYSWSNGENIQNIDGLSPGIYRVTATDADGCAALDTVTVGGTPEVEIMLFESNASCENGNDGVGSVVAFSGTAPFIYKWDNGITTSVNPNLTPGIYLVTVTDKNECSATGTVNIVGSSNITLTTTPSILPCAGDETGTASVDISGGIGPYDIEWSNNQSGQSISGLSSGVYGVTVTDTNECSATSSATISEPSAISIITTPINATCTSSNTGNATANASGGTPPFTYEWSDGQTGQDLTNVDIGDYSVTATDDNGCKGIGLVTILSANPPSCDAYIISNISSEGAFDGQAGVNTNDGTPPFSYEWSNGQVTSIATGLAAGTHSVTVTDSNGCKTNCSVTFLTPAKLGDLAWLDLNRDGCQDANESGIHDVIIQLSGNDNDGNLVVKYDTSDLLGQYLFDGLMPGSYNISVEIPTGYELTTQDGCGETTDSDINTFTNVSQNINLSEGDCYLDLDIGIYLECDNITDPGEIEGDEILCGPGNDAGPITEVSPPSGGSGAIEFLWMMSTQNGPFNPNTWVIIPGATGAEYDPDVLYETTYFARCARRGSCSIYLETTIVTKTVDIVATAIIEGPEIVCVNETETYSAVSAGPGATYLWNFGPTATPSTSTQQIVDVVFNSFGVVNIQLEVNANSCQASNNMAISVTDHPAWCNGNPLIIFGDTNVKDQVELEWTIYNVPGEWKFDVLRSKNGHDFEKIGQLSPSKEVGTEAFYFMDESPWKGTGYYKVQIHDEQSEYFAESNIISTSLFEQKRRFLIYPNPFEEKLKIDLDQSISSNIQIQIFSTIGKLIQTETVGSNTIHHQLDLTNLASGVYYVKMIIDNETYEVYKIVKK